MENENFHIKAVKAADIEQDCLVMTMLFLNESTEVEGKGVKRSIVNHLKTCFSVNSGNMVIFILVCTACSRWECFTFIPPHLSIVQLVHMLLT